MHLKEPRANPGIVNPPPQHTAHTRNHAEAILKAFLCLKRKNRERRKTKQNSFQLLVQHCCVYCPRTETGSKHSFPSSWTALLTVLSVSPLKDPRFPKVTNYTVILSPCQNPYFEMKTFCNAWSQQRSVLGEKNSPNCHSMNIKLFKDTVKTLL